MSNKKNLLIYAHYYIPDTASTGQILRELAEGMDDSDKDAFTLEDAEDMVEDQIRMDKEAGREPLAYDPQFFYDTIVELMEQAVQPAEQRGNAEAEADPFLPDESGNGCLP